MSRMSTIDATSCRQSQRYVAMPLHRQLEALDHEISMERLLDETLIAVGRMHNAVALGLPMTQASIAWRFRLLPKNHLQELIS